MKEYGIAVIPGDGIGKEVIPEGRRVLDTTSEILGTYHLQYEEFSWGTDYYLEHGIMMPRDALKILEGFDAIYLGAVGYPSLVPDHITLWGLLLPIRKAFEQYVNVRPTKLLPGVSGPLRDKKSEDIDFVVIRENTEGEYSGAGGRVHVGTPHEVALQTTVFTRTAVERVMRYSFDLAQKRPKKKLTSATKSNAQQYSFVFWDEVFAELSLEYPDVLTEKWHVDALTARFVTHPETLDVVVGSNLFADILTDLGGAIQGSMGLPPSANINPERKYPSMFESVHGSAPDIAGKGIANPIAAVWAGSMMMSFLGEELASKIIMDGISTTTADGKVLTPDLGGNATTKEVGQEICRNIQKNS
jgi:tartrate dehydrogenase/decarboxylase/D-malate dehydrogenase